MAGPTTTPKIEELRFRLKTDPKNRIFYVLAEELRRISQFSEAEQVLKSGLAHHPTYLSAWVSLGRVLREQKNDGEAIDALQKAMQLDPGNVVAARLLADAFLASGEKVEAIKKYKLVQALLPPDEELEAVIGRLEGEINASPAPAAAPPVEPEAPAEAPKSLDGGAVGPGADGAPEPGPESTAADVADSAGAGTFAVPVRGEAQSEQAAATQEEEPLAAAPAPMDAVPAGASNPFGSPWADEETTPQPVPRSRDKSYADLAPSLESVGGALGDDSSISRATPAVPPAAEGGEPGAVVSAAPSVDSGEAATPDEKEPAADADLTDTLTMADLYARQGLVSEARDIYEKILHRDPDNDGVRERLNALPATPAARGAGDQEVPGEQQAPTEAAEPTAGFTAGPNAARIARLQTWLGKVGRREVSGVR